MALIRWCICLFLLSTTVAQAVCDSGEVVIRFSHVNRPFDHPIGDAAAELETRVNEEMNGKACMEVFGNSLLYTDELVIQALLNNDIQLAAPNFGSLEDLTTVYRLFSLPFMFKNLDAVIDFQSTATGRSLLLQMQGYGIRGLGFWHTGMLQMSANEALVSPLNLEGKTFRISGSEVSASQFELNGAAADARAFAQTYAALARGDLDGTEETWANILGKEFFKVQEGITETNHAIGGHLLITSTKWLKTLPENVADQFLSILGEVTEAQNLSVSEQNDAARDKIIAEGGTVFTLSEGERRVWNLAMGPVWETYRADVNPVYARLIQKINERH